MTRYLLDTNTVSYLARDSSPAAFAEFARRGRDPDSELCISSITLAEIRYGLAKKPLSSRRIDAMERLVAFLKVLPWAEREAATYGILRTRLEAKGITVEAMDLLIAAQAIASGSVLVTHDAIFQRISDLHATVDWATDLS
jgi:tRNA(fMet)-specific endonuclease VapC